MQRLEHNPLSAIDSDHAGTTAALAGAPRLLDRFEPADGELVAPTGMGTPEERVAGTPKEAVAAVVGEAA